MLKPRAVRLRYVGPTTSEHRYGKCYFHARGARLNPREWQPISAQFDVVDRQAITDDELVRLDQVLQTRNGGAWEALQTLCAYVVDTSQSPLEWAELGQTLVRLESQLRQHEARRRRAARNATRRVSERAKDPGGRPPADPGPARAVSALVAAGLTEHAAAAQVARQLLVAAVRGRRQRQKMRNALAAAQATPKAERDRRDKDLVARWQKLTNKVRLQHRRHPLYKTPS